MREQEELRRRSIKTPQELRNIALALADLLYPRNGRFFEEWYPALCEKAGISCSKDINEWEDMTIASGLELFSWAVGETEQLLTEAMELTEKIVTVI